MQTADKCRYFLISAGVNAPDGTRHFAVTGDEITAWSPDNPIPQPTPAALAALDTDQTYIDWRLGDARAVKATAMSRDIDDEMMAVIPPAVRWHVIASTLARIIRDAGLTSADPATQTMYDAMSASAEAFGVTPDQAAQIVAAQVAAKTRHAAAVAAIDAIIAGAGTLDEKLTAIEEVTA